MKLNIFLNSLFLLLFVILIGSCRVVRKNRTHSQLFEISLKVDTSKAQTYSIETTRGDSSILIHGGYMFSSFDFYDEDTLISDSVVTQDGTMVVKITPGKNGKRSVQYRTETKAKVITPTYTTTKVTHSQKQAGTTQVTSSKATINTNTREVKNQMNGYILAALFIGFFIFIFYFIYNYFKK